MMNSRLSPFEPRLYAVGWKANTGIFAGGLASHTLVGKAKVDRYGLIGHGMAAAYLPNEHALELRIFRHNITNSVNWVIEKWGIAVDE